MPGKVPAEALPMVGLTGVQRRIVEALAAAYPRGMTRRALIDAVWFDDPNGGPDSAANSISVQISRINKKLPALGWQIGQRVPGYRGDISLNYIGTEK